MQDPLLLSRRRHTTATAAGPLTAHAALLNPWSSRQAMNDIDINFNAPVTSIDRDRADAERSMADIAWGLKSAQRKRGTP